MNVGFGLLPLSCLREHFLVANSRCWVLKCRFRAAETGGPSAGVVKWYATINRKLWQPAETIYFSFQNSGITDSKLSKADSCRKKPHHSLEINLLFKRIFPLLWYVGMYAGTVLKQEDVVSCNTWKFKRLHLAKAFPFSLPSLGDNCKWDNISPWVNRQRFNIY